MNKITVKQRTKHFRNKNRRIGQTNFRKRRYNQNLKRTVTSPNSKSSEESVIYIGTYVKNSKPVAIIDLTGSSTSLFQKSPQNTQKDSETKPTLFLETFLSSGYGGSYFSESVSIVQFSPDSNNESVKKLRSKYLSDVIKGN